jgi:hypothetical protein
MMISNARVTADEPIVSEEGTATVDQFSVSAYPNPYSERVTIEFESPVDTRASVDIFTLTGVRVKNLYEGEVKANTMYTFELTEQPSGANMLLYRIATPEGVKTGKLYFIPAANR